MPEGESPEIIGVEMSGSMLAMFTFIVDYAVLLDVSRAIALIVCSPLLYGKVFHCNVYGLVNSAPYTEPSIQNLTPATAILSDAAADNVTLPVTLALFAGESITTVGGALSVIVVLATVNCLTWLMPEFFKGELSAEYA